ncbi:hypothetical protein, partial [Oenococcus oeni]|uniref:hypothetical protein n=1 Tax=Oenococcus oeni TaxID=1247 RepID=UPI0015D667B2
FSYGDDVDFVNAGKAIDMLAAKFAEVGGSRFIVDLLASTKKIDGDRAMTLDKAMIDNWFAGHLGELFRVCLLSVEVNFGDLVFTNPDEGEELKRKLSGVLSNLLTQVN